MRRDEDSLMNPPLDKLLEAIPHKYELVLTATKRAKQIIRQQRLNQGQADQQLPHTKPLSIALHDIAEGRVDKETLKLPDAMFEDEPEDEITMFDDQEAFAIARERDHSGDDSYIDSDIEDDDSVLPDDADLPDDLDMFEADADLEEPEL